MSPSRAGSSHSSSWRIFSSARLVTFFSQLETKNWPKTSRSFDFVILNNYFSKMGLKMIKLCTIIHKLQYSTPWMSIVLHIFIEIRKFDGSFGVGTKICYFLTYILSVLSARFQLENWSAPARLGSARNLHSSAWLELENSSSNSSLD